MNHAGLSLQRTDRAAAPRPWPALVDLLSHAVHRNTASPTAGVRAMMLSCMPLPAGATVGVHAMTLSCMPLRGESACAAQHL